MRFKYDPEFCDKVVELAKQGLSEAQIAADLGVSTRTLKNWLKDADKIDFKNSYEYGLTCFEAYWESIGQKGTKGLLPKFNPQAWSKIMASRCKGPWIDILKQEVQNKSETKTMTNEEIDSAIQALLNQKNKNSSSGTPAQVA